MSTETFYTQLFSKSGLCLMFICSLKKHLLLPINLISKYTLQMSFLLQGWNSSPNLQTIPVLQPDDLKHKKP
jgi:hypothetical protein